MSAVEGCEKLQVQRSDMRRHNSTVLWELFLLGEKSVPYALKWSKRVLQCSRHLHRNKPENILMHLTEKRREYRETRFCMGLLEDRVDG